MAVASNSWKKKNVRNHFAERGGARGAGQDWACTSVCG